MSHPEPFNYQRSLPQLYEADVVVCGGGTAGAAAALAAARQGASVLLLEKNAYLGGTGVDALVSIFAYGFHDKERFIIGGIFNEVREDLFARHALIKTHRFGWEPYHPEALKRLWYEKCQQAGVQVLGGVRIGDAIVQDGKLYGVVVCGKKGLFLVKGKQFIDATGDADVAFFSGVPIEYGRESDHAIQPLTMMYVLGGVDIEKVGRLQARGYWQTEDGRYYLNATGFTQFIGEESKKGIPRDSVSVIFSIPWAKGMVGVNFGRVFVEDVLDAGQIVEATHKGLAQVDFGVDYFRKHIPGFEECYLISTGNEIGVRESRRIHGAYTLSVEDIKTQRQAADAIAQGCYMIDIHSPVDDSTEIYKLPRGTHYDIPYGCLLPEGIDHLLVAGRCISAAHEAAAAIRVQPICIAVGQAAGVAAALAAQNDCSPRMLPIASLQDHLRRQGAILE